MSIIASSAPAVPAPPAPNDPKEFISNQYSTRNYPKPAFPSRERTITGSGKPVRSIAWSCDGKKLATGLETRSLKIWEVGDVFDSDCTFSLPSSSSKPSPHNGNIAAVVFSPVDPHILVSGCKLAASGGVVVVWDVSKPREHVAAFNVPGHGDVISLAFHPSGRQFAAVYNRNRRDELAFYHLTQDADGKETWAQRTDIALGGIGSDIAADEINSFCFGNSGKYVSCVSNDGSLTAWAFPIHPRPEPTLPKEEIVVEDEGGPSRIPTPRETTPEPTEDGQMKDASQAEGEDIDMGDPQAATGTEVAEVKEDSTDATIAAIAEDEPRANGIEAPGDSSAVEKGNKDVEMAEESFPAITVNSSAPSRQPSPPPRKDVSDDTKTEIAQNRAKQLIRLRKILCGSPTTSLLALAFDPLGRYLAIGGLDGMLGLYDTQEWICQRGLPHATGGLKFVSFSYDGELLAAAGNDNSAAVYIISVATGEQLAKYDIAGMVWSMAWHPRRNWLAWSVISKVGQPVWSLVKQD